LDVARPAPARCVRPPNCNWRCGNGLSARLPSRSRRACYWAGSA